jgi:predicted NAD-dependent protein-ADP-ribosyltransferase YbiA (DUF1768 family)
MKNTIELFNPNDKPFGKLSNNYYHPFIVDGKKYETVTNYIYSNMLTNPLYKSLVQNTKIKGLKVINKDLLNAIDYLIKEKYEDDIDSKYSNPENFEDVEYDDLEDRLFQEYASTGRLKEKEDSKAKQLQYQIQISQEVRKPFETIDLRKLKQDMLSDSIQNQMGIYDTYNRSKYDEIYSIISNSITKGYEERLKNIDFKSSLLNTGNSPIEYITYDEILGTGRDGKGRNLIGKILSQIRHNIRMSSIVEEKNRKDIVFYNIVYTVYLAYNILQEEIKENKNILEEYLELSPKQIVEKYGLNKIDMYLSQDDVIKLYKRDELGSTIMKEIYQPGSLVINVRKINIRLLKDSLLESKKEIIFNSYLKYIILKNYKEEIDEGVKKVLNESGGEESKVQEEIIQDIISSQSNLFNEEFEGKIYSLFDLGMLSSSLSDIIDAKIKSLNIPTEQEVMEIENQIFFKTTRLNPIPENAELGMVNPEKLTGIKNNLKDLLKYDESDLLKEGLINTIIELKGGDREFYNKLDIQSLQQKVEALKSESWNGNKPGYSDNQQFIPNTGIVIKINIDQEKNSPDLNLLNPEYFTGMFSIDNKLFPTIQHYIITKLISSSGIRRKVDSHGVTSFNKGIGVDKAHEYILINIEEDKTIPQSYFNIESISKKYDELTNETDNILFAIHTATALNKKFEEDSMAELLLNTGDMKIVWNSPYSMYLGAGTVDEPGKNYVGITLMDIRQRLKDNIIERKNKKIVLKDLTKFIESDSFIMDWVKMRLQDMCDVVNKLYQYFYQKSKKIFDPELMEKLISWTLKEIYHPCEYLNSQDEIVVPNFFIDMVSNCKGLHTGRNSVKVMDQAGNLTYNKEISEVYKENLNQIQLLEDEFYGTTINRSKEEIKEMKDRHKVERENLFQYFIDNERHVYRPDKFRLLNDLQQKENKELNVFFRREIRDISKSDIAEHEKEISVLKKEFDDYLKEYRKNDKESYRDIESIAKIYWKSITDILSVLILNTSENMDVPTTDTKIKSSLIKMELSMGRKSKCEKIVKDSELNCIVSALNNLLVGIKEFKVEFLDNNYLDNQDVELAKSIILNNRFNYTQNKLNSGVESDNESDDELIREMEDVMEDEMERGMNEDGESDDENKSQGDYDGGYGSEENNFSFGKKMFSFDYGDTDLIKYRLTSLMDIDNVDEIAKTLMVSTMDIKNSNISKIVKENRINFFATKR